MSRRRFAGRPARALLAGGDAFSTRRHVWRNFVSSSPERIGKAGHVWTAGEFPRVPGSPPISRATAVPATT